jgi:hypothetical protein
VQHRHHAAALARQLAEQARQRHLVRRVEVGGGLVEQQQRRLGGQHARQQHALALAARELVQTPPGPLAALGARHGRLHHRVVPRSGRAGQAEVGDAAERHGLAHVEFAAALALLRHPGQLARALQRPEGGQGLPTEQDAAALRRQQAGQHAQQRGLAGAVGADDGGPAGTDVEVQILQHGAPPELQLQVAHADHRSPRWRISTQR